MNDRASLTEASPQPTGEPRLQALDLGALGVESASDQPLVCDIDDPDCELPEGILPATNAVAADDQV